MTPVLNEVHYYISGSGENIEALNLELDYSLDNINRVQPRIAYYGNRFHLEGGWIIDFLQRPDLDLGLELSVATRGEDGIEGVDTALGLTGESSYLAQNEIYYSLRYFFNEHEALVYNVGLALPVTRNSRLTVGFGNSPWHINENYINLGVKVGL